MKTLEQIKNEVAQKSMSKNWKDISDFGRNNLFDAVAERYASQFSREWIKVTPETLPGQGERVLVFCESQGIQMCYLNINNKWLMAYDSSDAHLNITHYQRLPELPKD